MCGRSSLHDAPVAVLERFSLPPVLPGFTPRFNIAPTQEQWTIALDGAGRPVATPRRWGLIPSWANDPAIGSRMINARSDSLAAKPAFRDSVRERRCVILADGYYEWSGTGLSRSPYFFHMSGNAPFAIAGLWDHWHRGALSYSTCTIITTDAGRDAGRIHDRMPAILTLDDAVSWVDRKTPLHTALALLRPYEREDLEYHEVSRFVNSPANDTPECIAPSLTN